MDELVDLKTVYMLHSVSFSFARSVWSGFIEKAEAQKLKILVFSQFFVEVRCLSSTLSDGQKRQAEVGDGGRPVQHPAAEEEEEGEEGSRS